ncbi:hypothetical protein RCL_jg4253.t2 [Rhizophagus clarus]|uniref:Uncharacterized protein n=1 Tax=Rhizophagus clarus TaxID=94130 RepID=A0A8H3QC66_9GLOM|nr:hypothetical protein RCL_jg4253.t2 [Rhizophagus clarus]
MLAIMKTCVFSLPVFISSRNLNWSSSSSTASGPHLHALNLENNKHTHLLTISGVTLLREEANEKKGSVTC